jgi:hypothetical protein
MKTGRIVFEAVLSAAVLLVLGFAMLSVPSQPAAAQNGAPAGKPTCIGCSVDGKTTPRAADGHPDLSGFWNDTAGLGNNIAGRGGDGSVLFDFAGAGLNEDGATSSSTPGKPNDYGTDFYKNLSQPPYKPEYAAKVKKIADETFGVANALDPQYTCNPLGIPRSWSAMHIVQTPQVIALLYESAPGVAARLIYTDGRGHPKDLDTSFMGDSVGHWEGDTLIVDVAGLNDETWLGGGFAGPRYASLHSDKEHVVERWTRTGDDLRYEATVDDPVMFTKPWVISPRRIRHAGADDQFLELICEDHDSSHVRKPTANDPYICNYCSTKIPNGTSIGKTH